VSGTLGIPKSISAALKMQNMKNKNAQYGVYLIASIILI
jgi:hypothetical protein